MGERENQQPDQHAGPSLLVPESNPATVDAVQLFMKNLLNLIALTPEEQQHQQQIASSHLLIEKYYEEKISNYDPTGKFQTKSELEVLDDGILAMIGLEFDKKGAVEKMSDLDVQFEADIYKLAEESPRTLAAIIASQATNDAESTTEWILTAHRLAPVIAGKAQQRREQVLSPPMFRSLLGSKVIISDVYGKKSKKKLKKQVKSTKLIEQPNETNATNLKPVSHSVEATQIVSSTPSTQQQTQRLIQILLLPQPFTIQQLNLPNQQQQHQSGFNSYHGWGRGRDDPFERDHFGNIYPYNNNNQDQQSNQFQNQQQQNELLQQISTFLSIQSSAYSPSSALQPKQE